MLMNLVKSGRNFFQNVSQLTKIREEMADQSNLFNTKLAQLLETINQMSFASKTEDQAPLDPSLAAAQFDHRIDTHIVPFHRSVFWGDRLLTLDKSAGFMEEERFASAYGAIRGAHQYDQYASPQTIAWRLHTLVWAAKIGLEVEGDFVECGVFRGDMSWVITQVLDFKSKNKQFYLFDTFSGFSEKYSSSDDFPNNPGFFEFANQIYSDPSHYQYVCERFKDEPAVHVIKGVVPDILEAHMPEKIAFMHIDLNSAAAEIGALELLFPRMSPGAILIFDDYGWKDYFKQKEAEDAFMFQRGYHILELPTGQGMVIKKS
ncbi:MAG: TylF/MycF family methyltransferase [Gammaproteobacteria bacterium]|nr:TylF/MycF family methyltransferase [Gammaproteobacteria bacterium]